MKRLRFAMVLVLGTSLPLLLGFSLNEYSLPLQTQRVRWDTFYRGATYSTETPRNANFSLPFRSYGYYQAGGPAIFRADGIACDWAIAGTTDGGTNNVVVDIVRQDGGIDCTCSLGSCDGTANTEHACSCAGGQFQTWVADTFNVMLDGGGTTCITTPAQMHCVVDWFR